MSKTVETTLACLQRHTDNMDLDSDFHKGFTCGKGKVMYFMYIWHPSGRATIYPKEDGRYPRYVESDQKITIHWK